MYFVKALVSLKMHKRKISQWNLKSFSVDFFHWSWTKTLTLIIVKYEMHIAHLTTLKWWWLNWYDETTITFEIILFFRFRTSSDANQQYFKISNFEARSHRKRLECLIILIEFTSFKWQEWSCDVVSAINLKTWEHFRTTNFVRCFLLTTDIWMKFRCKCPTMIFEFFFFPNLFLMNDKLNFRTTFHRMWE